MAKQMGRPPITDDAKNFEAIVRKLKDAFALGCTIAEACLYAEIGRTTFYATFKDMPDLLNEFEALQESPMILARKNWIGAFGKEPKLARDYALRKKAGEFGGRNRRKQSEFEQFHTKVTPKRKEEIRATLRKLGILLPKDEDIRSNTKPVARAAGKQRIKK